MLNAIFSLFRMIPLILGGFEQIALENLALPPGLPSRMIVTIACRKRVKMSRMHGWYQTEAAQEFRTPCGIRLPQEIEVVALLQRLRPPQHFERGLKPATTLTSVAVRPVREHV